MRTEHDQETASWQGGKTPPVVPDLDLIRKIGQGGFGEVWLARNRTTELLQAVKLVPLRRDAGTDPAGREVASIVRLEANIRQKHPNLLDVHHVGQVPEFLFYTMALADDVTGGPATVDEDYRPAALRERLKSGPLSPEECMRCTQQLLSGLACIHAADMVHRDVKPANCLFLNGELVLADFGLLTDESPRISLVGTPAYMPPDRIMDARADVYAAGLVIYEMITGLPANQLPRLGPRASQVAEDPGMQLLNRIVLRATEEVPKRRYRNAEEMLLELTGPKSAEVSHSLVRRRWLAAIGILTVAVFIAMIGFWWSFPRTTSVNFITYPYEATIYLDGELLLKPDGTAYTTPCAVPDIPARVGHVVFRREGETDLDAGQIDFAKVREVESNWIGLSSEGR